MYVHIGACAYSHRLYIHLHNSHVYCTYIYIAIIYILRTCAYIDYTLVTLYTVLTYVSSYIHIYSVLYIPSGISVFMYT